MCTQYHQKPQIPLHISSDVKIGHRRPFHFFSFTIAALLKFHCYSSETLYMESWLSVYYKETLSRVFIPTEGICLPSFRKNPSSILKECSIALDLLLTLSIIYAFDNPFQTFWDLISAFVILSFQCNKGSLGRYHLKMKLFSVVCSTWVLRVGRIRRIRASHSNESYWYWLIWKGWKASLLLCKPSYIQF